MNPRKEATYRMLSLIAAVIFVLPCVFLVFLTFNINPDDLWQMDSLMEFICAYKNTAILAIAGVLIQIVIALPAGYAIARIPSPKAQTFFLLTCVFFLLRTKRVKSSKAGKPSLSIALQENPTIQYSSEPDIEGA